jgi:hypothetical protein
MADRSVRKLDLNRVERWNVLFLQKTGKNIGDFDSKYNKFMPKINNTGSPEHRQYFLLKSDQDI